MWKGEEIFNFFFPHDKIANDGHRILGEESKVSFPRLTERWEQVAAVQRWRGWRSLFPFISLGISFHCWYTAGSANVSQGQTRDNGVDPHS